MGTGAGKESGSRAVGRGALIMPLQGFSIFVYDPAGPQYSLFVIKVTHPQGFSNYFCLMTEGSGAGSVLVTNGSGRTKTYGSGSATLQRTIRFNSQNIVRHTGTIHRPLNDVIQSRVGII
jgi:hypothetical protein